MSGHKNAQQAIEYWTDALTIDEPWLGWEYRFNGWPLTDEEVGWIPMSGHHYFDNSCNYRRKQKLINHRTHESALSHAKALRSLTNTKEMK